MPAAPATPGTGPRAAARPAAPALSELLSAAAQAVAGVRAGRSLNDELAALAPWLRPGAQALAFHALRHLGQAQALREQLVPRKPPPQADGLLLLALSLLPPPGERGAEAPPEPAPDTPRYAPHTVVDQTVRAAKRLAPAQAGMINAVLRRALREPAAQATSAAPAAPGDQGAQDTHDAQAARVAQATQGAQQPLTPEARWNHPRWWIEQLRRDWPQHWQALLAAANRRGPMTLRVNARWGDAPAYLALLRAAGLAAQAWGRHTVVLETPQPVAQLPLFDAGAVSVQDAAAQLAAPLLLGLYDGAAPLRPGARVLDACAAPGGKAAQLLEHRPDLHLTALDVDTTRAARIVQTLQRLGLSARVLAADAARPETWASAPVLMEPQAGAPVQAEVLQEASCPYDAILLDAPCSASGIVRRHPDVRWLRRPADLKTLAATQDRLLDALWPLLAPGGRLLYCTCSIFRVEGEARADAFLQRTPDARPAPAAFVPGHLHTVADNPALRTLLGAGPEGPTLPPDAFDSFFYALFVKLPGPGPDVCQAG